MEKLRKEKQQISLCPTATRHNTARIGTPSAGFSISLGQCPILTSQQRETRRVHMSLVPPRGFKTSS